MTIRRIRLKVGIVEVEVEGEQGDLDKVALNLLTRSSELPAVYAQESVTTPREDQNGRKRVHDRLDDHTGKGRSVNRKPTMATLASSRKCKTGPELARLACEYLHFVKSQPVFDRYDVLSEMKKVRSLYKKSFQSNVYHQHLKSLESKGLLRRHDNGYFSLSSTAVEIAESYFSEFLVSGVRD